MPYNKTTIDKIAGQSINEISENRIFKQGKIGNWKINEDMYYGRKVKSSESRANVDLGRMQEYVHTTLSKIDNPLLFKYLKRKNSQLKRVARLNALRQIDSDSDNWDIKDIVGKKQAIIYGRAIYSYYADSINNIYQPHLEPIDVYSFLIDKSCGGIDIEQARNMGDYSVILDKKQLKDGVKNNGFIKANVEILLEEAGNANDSTQEETNKQGRSQDQRTIGKKENGDPTKFKFWRWFTTYQDDGLRYYLLMDNNGRCIKCVPLAEMFPPNKYFPQGAFPYWTWAAFPDLTEFWTPSYCDYAREIFMTQNVSINQMLDNAEAINKPQKIVNVNAIENLSELKYRRDGIIKTKNNIPADQAIQIIKTPPINTPIEVFNLLEGIQQKASGVTDIAAGVSDEDGKVGIYEGNSAAVADRFGLLNKSYSFGYKRFARLYEMGVREHLTKKVAIDMIGPDGVEQEMIKRTDIFHKGDDFGVLVEASNAQTLASNRDKVAKITFLQGEAQNQIINQKKAFEMKASIAGYTEDEIKQLLDTSYYGNSELMSECDRDIESILDGKDIKVNQNANNAYKQKMVDYLKDHEEDISMEMFLKFADYINLLEPVIMKNEARALNNEMIDQMNAMQPNPQDPNAPQIPQDPEAVPEPAFQEPINNFNQQ